MGYFVDHLKDQPIMLGSVLNWLIDKTTLIYKFVGLNVIKRQEKQIDNILKN
jgi:hypothetical protein